MSRFMMEIRALFLIAAILASAPVAGSAQGLDLRGIGYEQGNPLARVVVIEFGDFGCSACGVFARDAWPTVKRDFVESGKVLWKYVPFVAGNFPNGPEAARAGECAGAQNAFWPMHDRIYEAQREWGRARNPRETFLGYAKELGLDEAAFSRCYQNDAGRERTNLAGQAARAAQVTGTPTFFINGQRVVGAPLVGDFVSMLVLAGGGN